MLAKFGNWIKDFSADETAGPAADTEWARPLPVCLSKQPWRMEILTR